MTDEKNKRLRELIRLLEKSGGATFSWDEPDFPSSGTHEVTADEAETFLKKEEYKVETVTIEIDGQKTVVRLKG